MPLMNLSALISPSTHFSFLASPSQPPFNPYSPPLGMHRHPSLASPPGTSSAYSPAAFSPNMWIGTDPKSLSRYRVLEGVGGVGVGGAPGMGGEGKVSDEQLRVLATLSQLSQSNGFSPPQTTVSAFNPLPLQPPPPHHTQAMQQQQQPQPQMLTPPQPQPQQQPQLSLQQPIPVAPLAQSSLLQQNITPPQSSSTLITTKLEASTPSQSPAPDQQQLQSLAPSLLTQLQLCLNQQIQQQAQAMHQHATSSPSAFSPSTISSQLQHLSQVQQVASHVLSTSSPQQLQHLGMLTQANPSALLMTLLQIAQQEESRAMEMRAAAPMNQHLQGQPMQQQQQQQQPMQALHSGPLGNGPQPYYIPGQMVAGGGTDPMYVALSEDVGPDGVRRKGKFLSGSSCHQCKTRRISAELVYCAQSHAKKGRTRKRRIEDQPSVYILTHPGSTSYKAERLCRKKYCARKPLAPSHSHTFTPSSRYLLHRLHLLTASSSSPLCVAGAGCLVKFYNEEPPAKIGPHGDRNWSCPGCRGLCTCAACKRQQSKRESKKKQAMAVQQAAAQAATQAAADGGKEGHPPVFSSTPDIRESSSKTLKTEGRPSPSSEEWKGSDGKVKIEQQQQQREARSEESNGTTSLVASNSATGSPSTSTVVSPATTQSMGSSSSGGTASLSSVSVSGSSQSDTPPSHLHHLPLSSVVTPAPVYSSLSSGFSHSPGMALSSLGGSLASSPLLPVNMSLHGLGFPSSFLSPQTSYTSLANLPLFPTSAFSSSPPSSPFPPNPHQLMLPHLSTPHLASLGLPSSLSASSASSSPSFEFVGFSNSLMPLTSASPITWQRSLRVAQLPAQTASTPSPERSSSQAQ